MREVGINSISALSNSKIDEIESIVVPKPDRYLFYQKANE